MKIAQIGSEFAPLLHVGNLADAMAGLSGEFAAAGHPVEVFLPGCRAALEHAAGLDPAKVTRTRLLVPMGARFEEGEVLTLAWARQVKVHLVSRDEYFDRSHVYGPPGRDYDDNDARYVFFCKAVVEMMARGTEPFDIVHLHDWPSALVPLFLRVAEAGRGVTLAAKTVLTLHNVSFQGLFPAASFGLTGLPDEFFQPDALEFFGQLNCLKGGIVVADALTTVSAGYRREILTPEGGHGLDGVLQSRAEDLHVIPHGIDTSIWNPETDTALAAKFSADRPEGREACRTALLKAAGISVPGRAPLVAMIDPPTDSLLEMVLRPLVDFLLANGGALVVAGGSRDTRVDRLESLLRVQERRLAGRLVFWPASRPHERRALLAGADLLLMPAQDEPGGPGQLHAQRYGCIPVASRSGGLVDSIDPIGAHGATTGTGFLFDNSVDGVRAALEEAGRLLASATELESVRRRLLRQDHSWRAPSRAYLRLFQGML